MFQPVAFLVRSFGKSPSAVIWSRRFKAVRVVTANRGNGTRLVPVTSEEDAQAYTAQVICPIIADGESIGAVVLLSREPAARMGDTELKVAETTASIVGRQMEQ